MGLEPTTTGITIRDSTFELRSPQLQELAKNSGPGLPGGTRTHNPQLRRLVLYPVELRAGPVVGVRGFEPPTSCSQSKRATRLRHTPKKASNDTLSAYSEQSKSLATGGL